MSSSEEKDLFEDYDGGSADDPLYSPERKPKSRRKLFNDEPQRVEETSDSSSGTEKESVPDSSEDKSPSKQRRMRPSKKRQRNVQEWARVRASRKRNHGEEYVDRQGNLHQKKETKPMGNHKCRYKCGQIDEDMRKKVCEDYWASGNWELQSSFLYSCVKIKEPVRKLASPTKGKTISTEFMLCGKTFLMKTLDISAKRINNICTKKRGQDKFVSPRDARGRKEPKNKTSEATREYVMKHISSFPKYSSHYSRNDNPHRRYLSPNLNLKIMYNLYKQKCAADETPSVKEHYYRFIFNNKFNLSFHRPHTDTCCKCDKLQQIITSGTESEKLMASQEKELHLRKAESVREAKRRDIEIAKNDSSIVAFTFDLQKTLPTPMLPSGDVYYARQLWTYNLGVHNLANNKATMLMWHEGQASRGNREISSGLLRFINEEASHAKHLIAYSDNCGGQNKSQKFVKFWLFLINTLPNLETVDHKFYVPGHSYMECDRDFGAIEKVKRKKEYVFHPNDWCEIVASASKNFQVKKMENFINIEDLAASFHGKIKGIRNMTWLHFEKKNPLVLFYKNTLQDIFPFSKLHLKQTNAEFRINWTVGENPIKQVKYNDLMKLMKFIPPCYHAFYKNLIVERKRKSTETKTRPSTRRTKEQLAGQRQLEEEEEEHEKSDVEASSDDNVYDTDYD